MEITTLPASGTLMLQRDGGDGWAVRRCQRHHRRESDVHPGGNATGSPYASFTFQVQDDGGTANGGVDLDPTPKTMTVNVVVLNHAPAGTDATVTTLEDTAYAFAVADFGFTDPNDSPPNNFYRVEITTLPTNGTLMLSGTTFRPGSLST